MLCRSEKSVKVSGNGHLDKTIQPREHGGWIGLFARWTLWMVVGFMGTMGLLNAQTSPSLYNPGQAKIDAQLKTWFANIEHVEAPSVNVSLLDFRLKMRSKYHLISPLLLTKLSAQNAIHLLGSTFCKSASHRLIRRL